MQVHPEATAAELGDCIIQHLSTSGCARSVAALPPKPCADRACSGFGMHQLTQWPGVDCCAGASSRATGQGISSLRVMLQLAPHHLFAGHLPHPPHLRRAVKLLEAAAGA